VKGDLFPAVGAALATLALLATAPGRPMPRLLWNTTASAPLGLYGVAPAGPPAVGEWLAVRPPEGQGAWLDRAGFLPRGALLLKRVAGGPGQEVCRQGPVVLVDGRPVAEARRADRWGRALPAWSGCRRLAAGEVFLLNPRPDSLDGRYLGVTRAADVVGRARALWTVP
jgi:type IV secretory pathway protease TraF